MNDQIKILRFKGFHGTEEILGEKIKDSNFQKSTGDDHWLGEGAYFFTEGIGSPEDHAMNWVQAEAFKKGYKRFAILNAEAIVNDDAFLDLRESVGIELFQAHKRFVLAQLRRLKKSFRSTDTNYTDGKVFEHMKQQGGIEVIISHMTVRFGRDRIEKIFSRIPNCTFLCVSYPEENIDVSTIEIIERGNI